MVRVEYLGRIRHLDKGVDNVGSQCERLAMLIVLDDHDHVTLGLLSLLCNLHACLRSMSASIRDNWVGHGDQVALRMIQLERIFALVRKGDMLFATVRRVVMDVVERVAHSRCQVRLARIPRDGTLQGVLCLSVLDVCSRGFIVSHVLVRSLSKTVIE